ncbi:MAG: VacB/RNase II family 3'-5' exoribonuclease, partial [Planctomycetes bacterium]|nr:VacB/RNase II family 3'-5' exoribonuclease [Planctomycetota bacterium]
GKAMHALDGDSVQIRIVRSELRGREPYAEIVRIVQRAPIRWVGRLFHEGRHWFVQPEGKTPAPLVTIDEPGAKNARPGDLVLIEPLVHTLGSPRVHGVIVERLGDPDETATQILGVIRRSGLPNEFSSEVRAAAQDAAKAAATIPPQREDLRELLTVTIDPPDARDYDDAISIEHLSGGETRLGVHIADVAHFVPAGSPLDLAARERGNSAYFPGYVVPMLPEVLSNGVCSLQPHQPRLTRSVFIRYDAHGRVRETRLASSVIRSHARLTYDQVAAALAGKTAEISRTVLALLKSAEKLAQTIRKRRLADGMISLTIPETEIVLGEDGRVADAHPADTSFSHTIIEMFMVEANEAVCRTLHGADLPHIRRVHPPPDADASQRYTKLLAIVGGSKSSALDRPAIQKLLADSAGRPEESTIHFLLLRCLSQACYSTSAEGHFALASEHYCHFTSPIRRYADLMVHRALDALLSQDRGGKAPGLEHRKARRRDEVEDETDLPSLALHLSMTERRAIDAEREIRHILLLQLMKSKIGESFPAVVTGVTSTGVFMRVERFGAEGFVHRADLPDDRWEFDRQAGWMIGRRSGRCITIGQQARVTVAGVDEQRQELALLPVGSFGQARRERRR